MSPVYRNLIWPLNQTDNDGQWRLPIATREMVSRALFQFRGRRPAGWVAGRCRADSGDGLPANAAREPGSDGPDAEHIADWFGRASSGQFVPRIDIPVWYRSAIVTSRHCRFRSSSAPISTTALTYSTRPLAPGARYNIEYLRSDNLQHTRPTESYS